MGAWAPDGRGSTSLMRFRLGFVSGFATGYYLGAKAGRERYNQIQRTLTKVKRSEAFETVTEKAKEVVGEGVDKAKDKAKHVVGRRSNGSSRESGNGSNATTIPGTPGPASAYAPY